MHRLGTKNEWRFAHVHIPRTAGSSIHSFFQLTFGADACKRYGSQVEVQELERLGPEAHRNHNYVAAHVPAWVLIGKIFPQCRFTFTVVRDPVAREISAYKYRKGGGSDITGTLENFTHYLDNIEQFGGRNLQKQYMCVNPELISATTGDVLGEYIKMGNCVITHERLGEFQEYLKSILGVQYIFENLNEAIPSEPITDQERRRLKTLIADDIALYKHLHDVGGMITPDWRFAYFDN